MQVLKTCEEWWRVRSDGWRIIPGLNTVLSGENNHWGIESRKLGLAELHGWKKWGGDPITTNIQVPGMILQAS